MGNIKDSVYQIFTPRIKRKIPPQKVNLETM